MRIYSMTATFGKLENRTLTLEPGLNIIHAPNEWGKSTWCAFLLAMLYGLDTRAKSTKTGLADKEHYAPWSGLPMSGRMELCWNGRDITIERTSKGRIPLGSFRAFETKTGLEVPELDAYNCGEVLLGVESSVFRRAGFIRFADLPVTQDDSFRRRLNALVTTGDESGEGARLEKGLKELKNRCRYNRSGLLPQAEREREEIQAGLRELASLEAHQKNLEAQLEAAKAQQEDLENHADALAYAASRRNEANVAAARQTEAEAQRHLDNLEAQCAALPSKMEAQAEIDKLTRHRAALLDYRQLQQNMPSPPEMPKVPKAFQGMEPEEALYQAQQDAGKMKRLRGPGWWILLVLALLFGAAGAGLIYFQYILFGYVALGVALTLAVAGFIWKLMKNLGIHALVQKYGTPNPANWIQGAKLYDSTLWAYHRAETEHQNACQEQAQKQEALRRDHAALCGSRNVEEMIDQWQAVIAAWDSLPGARREAEQAARQRAALEAMLHPAPFPARPDSLTITEAETRQQLAQAMAQQQHITALLGEARGRMAALGNRETMEKQLAEIQSRILALEKINAALTLAQQTLAQASAELQRRFAPRIAKGAQQKMTALTGGRYSRLALASDLTLQAGTAQETTLHDAVWRSEGTVDQLYLALRLSVAEELTPETPIILDDVLVRFDDQRMKAALTLLQDMAKERQIILFTCQEREKNCLPV